MGELFNLDNGFWRMMSRTTDIVVLGMLWLVTSLPVFTIGATTTAAYYVTLHWVRNEEGAMWRSYWKAFKENFKQATIIWLILLFFGGFFALDMYLYNGMAASWALIVRNVFLGLFLMVVLVGLFAFPVVCRFSNTTMNLLKMTVGMIGRNLFFAALLLVLFAGTVVLAILSWYGFPFWFFISGFYFFFSSFILNHVFKPIEKQIAKEEEGEA